MKTLFKYTFLIAISSFLLLACSEDFLDQKPTSKLTDATFYRNVAELELGLHAAYASLTSLEQQHFGLGNVGSDDSEKGGENETDQAPLGDISFSRQNPSNSWLNNWWNNNYAAIARCNQVIDKSALTQGDAAEITKIVNQAKVIRGMCYYHLVTAFGGVPLVTKFLQPTELELERAYAADIWAQVESDLLAGTSLPKRSQFEIGRVTSGFAWSMLGKAYMQQNKFNQAKSAFWNVVKSGEYQLMPDFAFNFRKQGENCAESIFEMQHKIGVAGGDMGTSMGVYRTSRDIMAGGWGFDCPTEDLLNEFEEGDPRTIYTIIFPNDTFPTITDALYIVENGRSPTRYHNRKVWIPFSEKVGASVFALDINYRYMRYAEVLLLYAEALNEVNKQDSALLLLNQIRARARNTPTEDPQRIGTSYDLSYTGELLPDVTTTVQSELRAAIWHEQRVELGMEGHRRNYLLRTDRFKTRMEAAKGAKGASVQDHEWLFPIPQNEIDLANGKIVQNPNY